MERYVLVQGTCKVGSTPLFEIRDVCVHCGSYKVVAFFPQEVAAQQVLDLLQGTGLDESKEKQDGKKTGSAGG